MRICQVIFSTNRVEYLKRTLESQKLLDFGDIETDKVFIDDYPQGRDDHEIVSLAKSYGYNEIILHGDNFGVGRTWTEFWSMIQRRYYDYIWHQEDDVVILEAVSIDKMVYVLNSLHFSQLVLMRQKWYPHEIDPSAIDSDIIFGGFRLESQFPRKWYFSSMASLYSMMQVTFPYKDWFADHYPDERFDSAYLNEGLVGKALGESVGQFSCHLKNMAGHNLCEHIGVVSQGKKLLPGEPGSNPMMCDPSPRHSATGVLV